MKKYLTFDATLWISEITLGLPLVFGISIPQLKVLVDPKYLVIGTLLPNDKTIGKSSSISDLL